MNREKEEEYFSRFLLFFFLPCSLSLSLTPNGQNEREKELKEGKR